MSENTPLTTNVSRAPWSFEQIKNLTARQDARWLHPYTCGLDPSHGPLLPIEAGWLCRCPGCPYEQDWAHSRDADAPPSESPLTPHSEGPS